ncbi:60 kDa neurofilament protein-like isoform X2 [Littorina saxatilis]|uniref:60 kDa neurofilament protein-like isoform X2 n=1 Tax=Littorina saxatilis TaxID=31220 RepID=UPI0038B4FF9E
MTSQSSIKETRTVISSSSRGGGMSSSSGGGSSSTHLDTAGAGDSDFYYKSNMSPRSSSVHRASSSLGGGGMMGGGGSYKRTVEISSGHIPAYSAMSSGRVTDVKNHREQEKKDMRDLNERFANYIEKMRFLEAQNRKLANELEELKSKWGKETSAVKSMYETELKEARDIIEETNKEKNKLEVRMQTLQDQVNEIMRQLDDAKKWRAQDRDVINKLNQQISDLEAELRMLRRTNDSLDTERQRDKNTINRLTEELEKLRIDLSNETIQRLDAENRAQTLAEELEFIKSVHEQELKELAALAYRDTTAENREFWKNELSQAIRDIQSEYDSKMDTIRNEMETFYNLKVQEFRTGATKQNMEVTHSREETKKVHKMLNDLKLRMADLEARNAQLEKQNQDLLRELEQKDQEHTLEVNQLKDEMNKLRAEMEAMLVELQTLMDAKLSLELEIAAYRKLLETEESRSSESAKYSMQTYSAGGGEGSSSEQTSYSTYTPGATSYTTYQPGETSYTTYKPGETSSYSSYRPDGTSFSSFTPPSSLMWSLFSSSKESQPPFLIVHFCFS